MLSSFEESKTISKLNYFKFPIWFIAKVIHRGTTESLIAQDLSSSHMGWGKNMPAKGGHINLIISRESVVGRLSWLHISHPLFGS